jgi:hypothetical protein
MTKTTFPALLFVLAGCTTAAVPVSSTTPGAAKQPATSTVPASDQAGTRKWMGHQVIDEIAIPWVHACYS